MNKLILNMIILLISQQVHAYSLIRPNSRGFDTNSLNIYFSSNGCYSGAESDVKKALEFWNAAVHANLELELAGRVSVADTDIVSFSFSQEVIIGCTADFDSLGKNNLSKDSVLAFALARDQVGGDNKLDKGYVMLNADPTGGGNISNRDSEERVATIAHEIGHVLGLGHSGVEGALMYFSSTGYEARLSQDDIDGIRHLYPQNELKGDYFLGCALVKNKTNTPISFYLLFLLPLMMFVFLRLRAKWSLYQ